MRHARVFAGVATFMFASSSLADAQTSAAAFSTPDDATSTVTTPASGAREKRFAPGTIAKTIVEEASRLTTDAVTWGQKLHELESLIESFIELMSQVFMLPIFHRRTSC
jgi:hypothetical protein